MTIGGALHRSFAIGGWRAPKEVVWAALLAARPKRRNPASTRPCRRALRGGRGSPKVCRYQPIFSPSRKYLLPAATYMNI
ncbi:MAG: hypothetical protein RLZZ519_2637 [Bacteroidota bacterium]|jgi:hypothetical protein